MKIAVVELSDRNYHDLTLYSIASIALHHRAPLDFFFMQSEYRQAAPEALEREIRARGHKLFVLPAPSFDQLEDIKCDRRITRAALLKAKAIEQLAHDYDYILYVDGDVLAFGDIECDSVAGFSELAAACLDLSSGTGLDHPQIFENCEKNGISAAFFNSGVMMINARKWLQDNIAHRFMENLLRHEEECPYFGACVPNDQCALNMTLGPDLKLLPVTWNVQKSALHTRAWATALVRHYTGHNKFLAVRPWSCDYREYALLRRLSRVGGLPFPRVAYDFGASYALNKLRRRKTVATYERLIADIERQRAQPTPFEPTPAGRTKAKPSSARHLPSSPGV